MSDASPPPFPHQPPQPPPPGPYPQSSAPYPPAPHPPPSGFSNTPTYGAPPPAFSPRPVDASAIRPRARWFWIGGAIMLLGVVAGIAAGAFGVMSMSNTVDDFARVSPGSDSTVRIESTGGYVVYTEDGSFFASVEIVSPRGTVVTTSRYLTELEYGFDGRSGRAFATFEAEETGVYTVSTDTPIAIGESIAGDLVRTIVIPLLIVAVTFLTGLIVIIATAVKRSRSKRRLAHAG